MIQITIVLIIKPIQIEVYNKALKIKKRSTKTLLLYIDRFDSSHEL